jgi:hypothetical protein
MPSVHYDYINITMKIVYNCTLAPRKDTNACNDRSNGYGQGVIAQNILI